MKIKQIKNHKLFWPTVWILIAILCYGIYILKDSGFRFIPTNEMKLLRQVEKSLGLPAPDKRSATDKGCYTTTFYKRVSHCDRSIQLQYADKKIYSDVQTNLEESWTGEENIYTSKSTNTEVKSFSYSKVFGNDFVCIQGAISPDYDYLFGKNETPVSINIRGSTDHSCRHPAEEDSSNQ